MTTSLPHQLFINYAPADEVFALRLADDLGASGANVWIDVRDARPGRHWTRSIEQALSVSTMMIVILSPSALDAPQVAAEWQAYLEAYRLVVPVIAQPCTLPGPLRTRRPLDFTRDRDYPRLYHQLVNRLIEQGTRLRRVDPVIWSLAEDVLAHR